MKLTPCPLHLCTSLQPNSCEVEAATQLPWILCQPPLPRGFLMRAPQVSQPQAGVRSGAWQRRHEAMSALPGPGPWGQPGLLCGAFSPPRTG